MTTYLVDEAGDTVDGNYSAGHLSLREAVTLANAGAGADTITFAAALSGTITLTGGVLALSNDVSIDGDVNGDHKADITISGNDFSRIFNIVGSGTDVHLDSLTLTNGYSSGSGGAIYTGTGTTLAITDSTIQNSTASYGGGIDTHGTLTVTGSTITGNTSSGYGGGVFVLGGQTATFTNTTIDGNHADKDGGGIDTGSSAHLTILDSTITDNTAGRNGGGVDLFNGTDATVTNSVIALNTATTSGDDISNTGSTAPTLTAGHSFFGTSVTVDTDYGGNINGGGDPLLAALSDNGGPVQTRSIETGSALIDAGSDTAASGLTSDANGNDRILRQPCGHRRQRGAATGGNDRLRRGRW